MGSPSQSKLKGRVCELTSLLLKQGNSKKKIHQIYEVNLKVSQLD